MAHRIISAGAFGFSILAASACTLTVQSGPSSPAMQAYAPAPAAPERPVYVPVTAARPPAPVPEGPVYAPVTAAVPSTPVPESPVRVVRPPTLARMPAAAAGPIAPMLAGTAAHPRGPRPVLLRTPYPHKQTEPPVSATARTATAPGAVTVSPDANSPLTAPRKPYDPGIVKLFAVK